MAPDSSLIVNGKRQFAGRSKCSSNRVILAICVSIASICCTQAVTFAGGAGIGEQIKTASIERRLEGTSGFVRQICVADDLIAMIVDSEGLSSLRVCNSDGSPLFEKSFEDSEETYLKAVSASQDGSTILVRQAIGTEWYRVGVLDLDGRERFNIHTASNLRPSYSGKYFAMLATEVSPQSLDLFGSNGELIRTILPATRNWTCEFIGDEALAVADDTDTLRLVSASTGELIWTRHLGFSTQYAIPPRITISQQDSLIFVYDRDNLMCVSAKNEVRWQRQYEDFLRAVILHSKSREGVITTYSSKTKTGSLVSISLETGDPIGSPIEVSRYSMPIGGGRFVTTLGGILTTQVPTNMTPGYRSPSQEYATFVVEFDEKTGALKTPMTIAGTFRPVSALRGRLTFVRIVDDEGPVLVSIPLRD